MGNKNIFDRNEILVEFARNMPRIRKKLGISQSELGKKVGLSRQSISSIERGIVPLTWNTLLAIAMIMIVNDPDIFMDLSDDGRFLLIIEDLKTYS